MKHQLTENVKLLQKIVLHAEGKVLLVKRSTDAVSRSGCWDLPGGNSEWPEEGRQGFGLHREDAARELGEETAIQVESDVFTQEKLVYFETFFDLEKQVFSIILGWRIELAVQPEVRLSTEHSESAWVKPEELETYDFGPTGGFVLETITRASQKHGCGCGGCG